MGDDLRALLAEALNDPRVPDALVTKSHEEAFLDVLVEYLAPLPTSGREALRVEADFLEKAARNAPSRGYTHQQVEGFRWAAGWVRRHAETGLSHHRPDWDEYFLGIARAASARGECVRSLVGCVLVRDKRLVATGYNGVGAGQPSCLDGACPRGRSGVARRSEGGPGYDVAPCIAFHAEDNAVTDAIRRGIDPRGCTAYLTKEPCPRCRTMLAALQIQAVWHDNSRQTGGSMEPELPA